MKYCMQYNQPAEDSASGWENQSLPIGNGYMGANVFGGILTERIQVTEETLFNPQQLGGFNSLADIYVDFPHESPTGYKRGLDLDNALAFCAYSQDQAVYSREVFASYPDKVLVARFDGDIPASLDLAVRLKIPYVKDYSVEPGDGGGKSGAVSCDGNTMTLKGILHGYQMGFEARLRVLHEGGVMRATEQGIQVQGANHVTLLFTAMTDYQLSSHVFLEEDETKKLKPRDLATELDRRIDAAEALGYSRLKQRHLQDYQCLFGRVSLNLGEDMPCVPTDALLKAYAAGTPCPYLEALYFQYGRYLLVASSRPGTLPASLQGVWNCHDLSPWGSGFWHNINVQMNYWPAFTANLAETFEAYVRYNEAFRPKAEEIASKCIEENVKENYKPGQGECGWTIGTSAYPFEISAPGGHSGPGTGALTSKMFWDYYDFTRDRDILAHTAYPAIEGMAKFLTKSVRAYDGLYLADPSASPEQLLNRDYLRGACYYQTIGCAFDQQLIWENGRDLLEAAGILGRHDETVSVQKMQQDHYQPVEVGLSGQIKEYSEEGLYGEIGEYYHRHISQLMAVYPGTRINTQTPAWMDAAKLTLEYRGDDSTGWALAHRLNAWARLHDGDHAYALLHNLLAERTMANLWDLHPPFQIDGNFGGTAGIAEMLLQSHEGCIAILPALPSVWRKGQYRGLVARGNFEVSAAWENGLAYRLEIHAKHEGPCVVEYNMLSTATLHNDKGDVCAFDTIAPDRISFMAEADTRYVLTDFKPIEASATPEHFRVENDRLLWTAVADHAYILYVAADNASEYTLLASGIQHGEYRDTSGLFERSSRVTYRLTAKEPGKRESSGALAVRNHKTPLEMARYRRNLSCEYTAGMHMGKKKQT